VEVEVEVEFFYYHFDYYGAQIFPSKIIIWAWVVLYFCNDLGKSASHICAITSKGLVNLELFL
jgi:hypothetical protein